MTVKCIQWQIYDFSAQASAAQGKWWRYEDGTEGDWGVGMVFPPPLEMGLGGGFPRTKIFNPGQRECFKHEDGAEGIGVWDNVF